MRGLYTHTLLLGSLFWLLVGCGEVSHTGTISGTVTAPNGGDVAGTEIIACYRNERDCKTFSARVTQPGSEAPYRISGLPSGAYGIYALKDTDGDGNAVGNGDYHGVYAPDPREVSEVTPPAEGVDITMRVLTGVSRPDSEMPLAVRKSATGK